MGLRVSFHTLGCKVNAYETEAMQEMLAEAGYELVPFDAPADICVINTCSVTNIADRKSRQMLHKARKLNPGALVAAVGCYAQEAQKELLADAAVDLVIGNNRKKDLPELLKKALAGREKSPESENGWQEALEDLRHPCAYEPLFLHKTREHTRAYIKVQDGCNQFCAYCIIPYLRGRVRSRRPEDVRREAEALAASGTRELVLTGIHLSSYGTDLEDGCDLLALIRMVHGVEGICRIRLGSLEPGIITEEFAEALAKLPKVCPHFHLSLQSGCAATLKRMNRRYTPEEYLEKCRLLRRVFDHPAITTDVIAGFPQESEEEFRESRDFLEKVHFFEMHVFKYSRRKGTAADRMDGQIPEEVKAARSDELLRLEGRMSREYRSAFIGKEVEILLEEELSLQGAQREDALPGGEEKGRMMVGHTPEYVRCILRTSAPANTLVKAVGTGLSRDGESLLAASNADGNPALSPVDGAGE